MAAQKAAIVRNFSSLMGSLHHLTANVIDHRNGGQYTLYAIAPTYSGALEFSVTIEFSYRDSVRKRTIKQVSEKLLLCLNELERRCATVC